MTYVNRARIIYFTGANGELKPKWHYRGGVVTIVGAFTDTHPRELGFIPPPISTLRTPRSLVLPCRLLSSAAAYGLTVLRAAKGQLKYLHI